MKQIQFITDPQQLDGLRLDNAMDHYNTVKKYGPQKRIYNGKEITFYEAIDGDCAGFWVDIVHGRNKNGNPLSVDFFHVTAETGLIEYLFTDI